MIRPIATVSAGTLASRLTGFVRDALIAALFGTGVVADAFLFAFQAVNVARRLLSEGALNAVLVPAYLRNERDGGAAAAAAFAGRVLGTIGIAVLGFALLLAALASDLVSLLAPGFVGQPSFQLAVDSMRLMLPYLAFAGPVAAMAAVLNARGQVGLTSFSPLLFNAVMIAIVLVLLTTGHAGAAQSAYVLAAATGAAGCLQLIFLAVSGVGYARPVRIAFDTDTKALFRRALPGMIAQSGPQLLLVGGAIVASASPAAVSWIYFASRLVELPLGLVSATTGAVLIPRLSGAAPDAETSAETSGAALQLAFGLALPASVGLGLLAEPIVALLFEHGAFTADDTRATALALTILATALPAMALTKPLSAIHFAREQMMPPLIATLAGLLACIAAASLSHPRYGYAGVTAGISLAAWVIAIWLGAVLALRGELPVDTRAVRNIVFIVLATAVMEGAILLAWRAMPGSEDVWTRLMTLGTLIVLGMLVYAAALRLFGVINFRIIRRAS